MSSSVADIARRVRRLAGDRSFLLYLANFGLGKGIAFVGPIALGLTLGPQLYGALEFGLALAAIIAMLAAAGTPQAVMQLVLMRERRIDDLLFATTAVVAALSLTCAVALTWLDVETRWRIAAALVALCAAQQAGVAYARAHAMPNFNVWIDHAPTVIVVIVALGLSAVGGRDDARTAAQVLTILAAFVCCLSLWGWRRNAAAAVRTRFSEAMIVGLPILASSLIGVWIVASGRVWMGLLLGDADVHAWAFTFRVASLLVLVHAIVATGFAAKLYKMPTRRFDPIAATLVGVVAVLAVLFVVFSPEKIAAHWLAKDAARILEARPAVALVSSQVFFWVAGAIVEVRVARARAAWIAMFASFAIVLATSLAITVFHAANQLDFRTLAALLLVQQIALCGALHLSLWRRRTPARRAALATLIGGCIVVGLAIARS